MSFKAGIKINFTHKVMIKPNNNPVQRPLNSRSKINNKGVWKWQKLLITDEKPKATPILNTSR